MFHFLFILKILRKWSWCKIKNLYLNHCLLVIPPFIHVCRYIEIIIILVFSGRKKTSCTNNRKGTLLLSVEVDMVCAIKSLPHPNTTFYREK